MQDVRVDLMDDFVAWLLSRLFRSQRGRYPGHSWLIISLFCRLRIMINGLILISYASLRGQIGELILHLTIESLVTRYLFCQFSLTCLLDNPFGGPPRSGRERQQPGELPVEFTCIGFN